MSFHEEVSNFSVIIFIHLSLYGFCIFCLGYESLFHLEVINTFYIVF